jgi:hypothetical protein
MRHHGSILVLHPVEERVITSIEITHCHPWTEVGTIKLQRHIDHSNVVIPVVSVMAQTQHLIEGSFVVPIYPHPQRVVGITVTDMPWVTVRSTTWEPEPWEL